MITLNPAKACAPILCLAALLALGAANLGAFLSDGAIDINGVIKYLSATALAALVMLTDVSLGEKTERRSHGYFSYWDLFYASRWCGLLSAHRSIRRKYI